MLPDEDTVWGVVLEVPDEQAVAVMEDLLFREKAGYRGNIMDVERQDGSIVSAVVFASHISSNWYGGEEPASATAAVIRDAHGPSGSNIEYFDNCVHALREAGVHDPYLEALWKEVHAEPTEPCCSSAVLA